MAQYGDGNERLEAQLVPGAVVCRTLASLPGRAGPGEMSFAGYAKPT